MKIFFGLFLGLFIGAGCRVFLLPLPSPPVLLGALLVVAMTCGYIVTDKLAAHRALTTKPLCGGPTGETAAQRSLTSSDVGNAR